MIDWKSSYRAYDDDTLVALANVGLLRRAAKDLDAGKVHWAHPTENASKVLSDGQLVELDARGPQHARCDCPAPGICKHILAAVLWLRTLPDAAQAGSASPNTKAPLTETPLAETLRAEAQIQAATPPELDPLAEVLAQSSSALFKSAGAAATREAERAQSHGEFAGVEWRVQGSTLVIELATLGVCCRWIAGAGFAGMISEVAPSQRKSVHLIALAALRAANNVPLQWPPRLKSDSVQSESTKLAATNRSGEDSPNALASSERAFLVQVRSALDELLCAGLSHVSTLVSARLLALNMSARGEGLPRLAGMLRNLGGMVELLVRHDHQAQERDALALMSKIDALCDAMLNATDAGDSNVLRALRGRSRRSFGLIDSVELLPLGVYWWQSLGGARGLTAAFWDAKGERLLQASLARPDASDVMFTRQGAWSAHSLWPGAGTVAQLCQAALTLTEPRLAEDDRLAVGGMTRAQTLPIWSIHDPRLANMGCNDWSELADQLREMTGLSSDVGEILLLRPSKTRAPTLQEAQQQLHWPIADFAGCWLNLVLPLGEQYAARAETLDRFAARQAPVHAILVRIERSHANTHLVPVACLSANDKSMLEVVSFDFAKEAPKHTSLTDRILRLFQSRRDQAPLLDAPQLIERLLLPVLNVVESQALTGRMALTRNQCEQLESALSAIASVGLDSLVSALKAHIKTPCPQKLLRLHRLSQWLVELGGLPHT